MLRAILDAPRPAKRLVSVAYDTFALSLSLYAAWALRLDTLIISPTQTDFICLAITVVVSIFSFIRLGLYRAILRFMAQDATTSIMIGLIISAITLAASSFFLQGSIPRSVPIIYLLTASVLIGLPRLMVRNLVHIFFPVGDTKVLIYGAGSAGRILADSLRQSQDFHPVAFIDDDRRLIGNRIRGLQVHSGKHIASLLKKHHCTKVFLAIGATERTTKLRIIRQLESFPVQIQTIPPLEELTKGDVNITEIRDIQIEDLLGRDPVQPNESLMGANIKDKIVMVTGAGGSIGSELCRQIIKQKPKALLLFDLNEYNLYRIEQELLNFPEQRVIALLGSVQNEQRLQAIMKHFSVQTVYHAAAYKHVPLVEHNMVEGIENNVLGTYHCALAAKNSKVDTFVLISTDKAVRSTNIMGASKRLAEMVVQFVASQDNSTRYSTVRFGNVLGSSGSVVPKFRQQIEQGGPVTVTHPEVTRYFMTIPEASQLVIQAGAMAKGGETYVLEMGEPVKISELAKEMIRLSGYTLKNDGTPHGNIELSFTGLRPGEKLHEELLITDAIVGTKHPRITEAIESKEYAESINEKLQQLQKACNAMNYKEIKRQLLGIPNVLEGNEEPNDHLSSAKPLEGKKPTLQIIAN